MLIHSQREAELAKKRLEAQETKKQALLLQKQTDKNNKKAEQERIRYEKSVMQQRPTRKKAESNVNIEILDPVEKLVHNARNRARELNPLRRARASFTNQDGSNNPNIDGQDNGMNAWLDMELNEKELDTQIKLDTRYAKKNSDRNRCYNIDDIPIRGPPRDSEDIESVISISDATKTANDLLNDQNLYVCRNTGMMRQRDTDRDNRSVLERDAEVHRNRSRSHRRNPTATVTVEGQRSEEWRDPIDRPRWQNRRNRPNRDEWHSDEYHRYENTEPTGWDTEINSSESSPNTDGDNREAPITKPKIQSHSRERDQYYQERDRERDRYYNENRSRRERERRERRADNKRYKAERKQRRATPPLRHKGRHESISTSDSELDTNDKVRKVKSGITAKPTTGVLEQKMYPHFSLGRTSGFIGQNVRFENLTYEQFMAGELLTINSTIDMNEARGRTKLLQRVAMWRLRTNVSWPQVRQAFAAILRMVEDHEIGWNASWDDYERRIYDKVLSPSGSSTTSSGSTGKPRRINNNNSDNIVWFCKNYQRIEGCSKEAPHQGRIGNMVRQLHHICAACWLKDRIKRSHSESSSECPQKDA